LLLVRRDALIAGIEVGRSPAPLRWVGVRHAGRGVYLAELGIADKERLSPVVTGGEEAKSKAMAIGCFCWSLLGLLAATTLARSEGSAAHGRA
jgi:hypothetical protein